MKRETFVAILGAALAEADEPLLIEAANLIQGRWRTVRQEKVQAYAPGDRIAYVTPTGTARVGTVHHLNKLSVTVHREHPTEGFSAEVVAIDRVVGLAQDPRD